MPPDWPGLEGIPHLTNTTLLRASGRPALRGFMPTTRVGRAKERGETTGFMKVLIDPATDLILGATLFCIEVDGVVHCLLDVMAAGKLAVESKVEQRAIAKAAVLVKKEANGLDPLRLERSLRADLCSRVPGATICGRRVEL